LAILKWLVISCDEEHVSGNLEKTKLCESCDVNLEEAGEEEQVSDNLE
jgi:hypothetical protein